MQGANAGNLKTEYGLRMNLKYKREGERTMRGVKQRAQSQARQPEPSECSLRLVVSASMTPCREYLRVKGTAHLTGATTTSLLSKVLPTADIRSVSGLQRRMRVVGAIPESAVNETDSQAVSALPLPFSPSGRNAIAACRGNNLGQYYPTSTVRVLTLESAATACGDQGEIALKCWLGAERGASHARGVFVWFRSCDELRKSL